MPGPSWDCYVLAPERSAKLAARFLDAYLPHREPSCDPSDPSDVLGVPVEATHEDVFEHLAQRPSAKYSMYWQNKLRGEPYMAIVVFNDDGSLVLGLNACGEDDGDGAEAYLDGMKAFAGTTIGVLGLEQAPPSSAEEFHEDTWFRTLR